MLKTKAQKHLLSNRTTDVVERRATDVMRKHETALTVGTEDEERKAFERIVDQACEILNNFKVPKRKRLLSAVIFVLLLAVLGGICYSIGHSLKSHIQSSDKEQVMPVQTFGLSEDLSKLKQVDRNAGYSGGLIWYKYHVLQGMQQDEALKLLQQPKEYWVHEYNTYLIGVALVSVCAIFFVVLVPMAYIKHKKRDEGSFNLLVGLMTLSLFFIFILLPMYLDRI